MVPVWWIAVTVVFVWIFVFGELLWEGLASGEMWEMGSVEMEAARFWARVFAPLKG